LATYWAKRRANSRILATYWAKRRELYAWIARMQSVYTSIHKATPMEQWPSMDAWPHPLERGNVAITHPPFPSFGTRGDLTCQQTHGHVPIQPITTPLPPNIQHKCYMVSYWRLPGIRNAPPFPRNDTKTMSYPTNMGKHTREPRFSRHFSV
jgi:hypothetical protein